MWGDTTTKVDNTYVNHIIHVTHARPFGLVLQVLCLYILGLTRTTLVNARHIHSLYPRRYVNFDMATDRHLTLRN
jgi:hypothetical protein